MERNSFLKLNSRYDVKRGAESDENLFRQNLFEIRWNRATEEDNICRVLLM